ncbi:hypothetical protein HHI36_003094 [Cryptolaemus montrouzieri]|uniref:Aminotransferase class I/classII large domain-containing protein n=1 Tax=Cryptolaemus montrouzieri TaxID=559131 RepID=A0ABD2PCG4_9CUCU
MTSSKDKFRLPKKYRGFSTNIWNEITNLINQYKPLNLGMGFPDFPPPKDVTRVLSEVATDENFLLHQYSRQFGHLRLVNALAKFYGMLIERDLNPHKEILINGTGCQALFTPIMAHVEEEDEVIIIEPYFDFYETIVKIAGGKCKFIPLRLKETNSQKNAQSSCEWSLDKKELENVFNEKTKMFILNTPNNPLGKVFNLEELTIIADLCKKWNVLCLADEVYEFFIYSPNQHIRICTLPGMWERTITTTCPGKTFNVTGWALGVAYGPENLLHNLKIVENDLPFVSTPIQEAFAIIFEQEIKRFREKDSILVSLPRDLEIKRDFMVKTLIEAGMKPVIPEGGFLISVNWKHIASRTGLKLEEDEAKDFQFTKWMIRNIGLAGIPVSAFYSQKNKHLGEDYIRFCFLKEIKTLQQFADITKKLN